MEEKSLLYHESVWGSEDSPNPFEIKVAMGNIGTYGSYLSGLPSYPNQSLQLNYSRLREFAQWAIENKVCLKCRYPWDVLYITCSCGKYEANKELMDSATKDAKEILDFDEAYIRDWANQIEIDLQGDSEYAQLNRKAREIMGKRIDRYNRENSVSKPESSVSKPESFLARIIQKKTWKDWARSLFKWFRPSYWAWRFTTAKEGTVKSIPLYATTDEIIKQMSFGTMTTSGNCCIRTKSGSVLVVPAGMVDEYRKKYKDAVLVAPKITS